MSPALRPDLTHEGWRYSRKTSAISCVMSRCGTWSTNRRDIRNDRGARQHRGLPYPLNQKCARVYDRCSTFVQGAHMRLALFASILTLAAVPALAPAQNLTFAALSGTLTDSAGAVIPGAAVNLVNEGTQDRRSAKTDASGFYQILNVPPANY